MAPAAAGPGFVFEDKASEDKLVAAAGLRAGDGEVLQPPAQQLEERHGQAQPLQPGFPPEHHVALGELPDFAHRDDRGVVSCDGLLQRVMVEVVAVRAGLLLQVLFARHDIVAPLQELRSTAVVLLFLFLLLLLLEYLSHVGGDKRGVLAVGEGALGQLQGDEPLHQLGRREHPEDAVQRLLAGAPEVVEDEVAELLRRCGRRARWCPSTPACRPPGSHPPSCGGAPPAAST
jgi:hypothetical protein